METVPSTKVAEFSATEAALTKLAADYKGVVFDVTTKQGMKDAKGARATLRSYRTSLEALRVQKKEFFLKEGQKIDSEARRIRVAFEALEDPIDAQIKAEETKVENARLAAIKADQDRIAAEELARKQAEEKRLADERADLARQKAELERQQAAAKEAEDKARLEREELDRKARQKIEDDARAARQRLDEEARQARAIRDEADRKAKAAIEAADAAAKKARDEEEARLKAAREVLEAEAREIAAAKRKAQEEAEEKAAVERRAEEDRQREIRERNQAALSEIQGIQHQVLIAQMGRLGVRAGGTIECIRETLAETEAWQIDARFGALTASATTAKNEAIRKIRELLAAAEAREAARAEEERLRKAREADEAQERERLRAEAEDLDAQRMLETFVNRFGHLERYASVAADIKEFLADEPVKKAA